MVFGNVVLSTVNWPSRTVLEVAARARWSEGRPTGTHRQLYIIIPWPWQRTRSEYLTNMADNCDDYQSTSGLREQWSVGVWTSS